MATPRPATGRSWREKFADAFRGLAVAIRGQASIAVHLVAAVAVIAAAAGMRVSLVEWALLAVAIGGVIAAEIFNSAVEALARSVGTYPDPGIRDALDMAAAAVLVAAAAAVAVGVLVFGPRLLALVS